MTQIKTKYVLWTLGFLVFFIALYSYWEYEKQYPSTEDAYLQTHVTPVASQVSGKVSKIYVSDNQIVVKGAPLFDIDSEPFQIAVNKARANLEWVQQQVAAQENTVNVTKANIDKFQAELVAKEKNYQRLLSLVQKGRAPKADGDNALANWQEARANVNAAKDEYEKAKQLLGQIGNSNAQVRLAKAELEQAKLDLQHTFVVAPSAGKVTQFNLRQGAPVNQNQALFSLVALNKWWVKANFKETALANVFKGQEASVQIDMYPNVTFKGVVESIGAGSDAAFSIFPAENASGNWVKVTQRIPVKIQLINPDPRYPLHIGASSQVTIDARATAIYTKKKA